MNRNQVLAAVVGTFVLYGLAACQSPPVKPVDGTTVMSTCDQHQARHCHGSQCDIEIAVSSCSAAGITVSVPDLHLCKRDGRKTINWKLAPGGPYKFRDDGIDFKNLPDTQDFDPATRAKGPFKYSWDDKLANGGGRQFEYGIRLVDSSGHHCDKDPRISND